MSTVYDDKGKIFTNVVSKIPVPSLIQTTLHLIRGNIHVRPEERIKNELDRAESFLAITDARILDSDGKELYHTAFMAVMRSQIVWVMPEEGEKSAAQ